MCGLELWNGAILLPHKENTVAWKLLCLGVQHFCFRTQNNLWLEVPQFNTIYSDLNFRSSASARKNVIWNSARLLLHENITFLWKIHSHSTTHPFLNFRAVLHEWWTLWMTETKESGCSWQKSSLTFGYARHKLMTHYVHTGTVSDRVARQASRYDRENEAVLLCWHTYVNAFGRRQYLPDVKDYLPVRSITVCGKKKSHQCGPPLKGQTMTRRHRLVYVQWARRHFIW